MTQRERNGERNGRRAPAARILVRLDRGRAVATDTALSLSVQAGEAPMRVNSPTKVANLNSDKLDGKDSTEIGVNGWERVTTYGEFNSTSPKVWQTSCPSGKVVVGTGFDITGGKTGFSPDALTNVVIDEVFPLTDAVLVTAYEEEATTADWQVGATAICATAP